MMSKVAAINIWSVFLLAMAVLGAADHNEGTVTVKSMCDSTDYKEACEKSLKSTKSNEPKEVIKAGFQAAVDEIKYVLNHSNTVEKAAKDPRSKKAIETCKEVMQNAIDDFQKSLDGIESFQIKKLNHYIQNLEVWLGGAVAYEQTCLDSFENSTGDAGKKMHDLMKNTVELTSNALAMVSKLHNVTRALDIKGLKDSLTKKASQLSDGAHRRLLSEDGFPSWISATQRMLLQAPAAAPKAAGSEAPVKASAVVAQDGSGQYKTITEALKQVKLNSNETFVIQIKAGVYKEQVEVAKGMNNVVFIGDGPTKTKITGSLNFVDGVNTFKSATVAIVGDAFTAKNIGFENSAGAAKHQAVALRVQSDQSVFYNCQMDAYQDTLYAHSHRQFYKECTISGTVDFIFGDAQSVFQSCKLVIRKPLASQRCMVTAQGKKESREISAIVLQNCTIVGDGAFTTAENEAYLGRPWKEFSKTIIMDSFIDKIINPAGWYEWEGNFALDTLFYAEFNNRGPGADQSQRVKWKGIQKIDAATAASFAPGKYMQGETWIPQTGVPFS